MRLKDQPDIEFCNVKRHRAFIELIARMTIDDEHDVEDTEALHSLIEKAREITGIEPEEEEPE